MFYLKCSTYSVHEFIPANLTQTTLTSIFFTGEPGLPTPQPSLFKSLGCWKDTWKNTVPTLEGKDARLTGSSSSRDYAIHLCYKAAKAKGYHVFVVQNGWGGGMRGSERYRKFGKSTNCRNGKGGSSANDVYQIGGRYIPH